MDKINGLPLFKADILGFDNGIYSVALVEYPAVESNWQAFSKQEPAEVKEMKFSKPSISIARKKLREQGLVEMDQNGYISLLPSGREIAERIYARHELLTRVLIAIGVEEPVASDEACRIEHVIDDDTYNKINSFYEKFMKEQA